jgi:hypothetical protein
VQILIDKSIGPQAFGILRKMKPIRRIEAAAHMARVELTLFPLQKSLWMSTKPDKPEMLEGPAAASKRSQANSIAARSMLEEENKFLPRDLKSMEESCGTDILTLTVACDYLDRLLNNAKMSVI